ncbi:hypothetical protein OOZ63_22475 [Paucibacter sp. PLA-PC-4]|uniref:hypothetical protein n=1 Tax=Paucibacter sp. PLA-PC-4 TaxID=2993655 RepID=UPI00224AF246|nr:hypothetical protein [Paucibacter sp. PLA-PC-4]MCX2864601.1 hypothetical protein [Paucibacter sp. PLA-PC-4]
MELLNDVRFLAVLFAVPVWVLLNWVRLRERQWLLSSKRRRAIRELFKKSAWKKAAPLDFHCAMTDAYGRSVEPVELVFIEARQSPVRLLLDRIEAGPWVKFLALEGGYRDPRGVWAQRWLPFGRVSALTTLAASLSVSVLLLLVPLSWQRGGGAAAALVGMMGVFWVWLMFMFSLMADAAKRVLSSEHYQPAIPLPKPTRRKPV